MSPGETVIEEVEGKTVVPGLPLPKKIATVKFSFHISLPSVSKFPFVFRVVLPIFRIKLPPFSTATVQSSRATTIQFYLNAF